MRQAGGRVTASDVMAQLADVAQESTQWSVVYGMANGQVDVAYSFRLEMVEE